MGYILFVICMINKDKQPEKNMCWDASFSEILSSANTFFNHRDQGYDSP